MVKVQGSDTAIQSPRPLVQPSRRASGSRRGILVAVLLIAMLGASTAVYLAARGTDDGLARARAADASRWAGQAEAYLGVEAGWRALERGREADASRWQAMAEVWLGTEIAQAALERGREADAARWAAQAEAWLAATPQGTASGS